MEIDGVLIKSNDKEKITNLPKAKHLLNIDHYAKQYENAEMMKRLGVNVGQIKDLLENK
ncbi:hypothetical protein Barb4_03043 [Bacteroidales bacterium Barb4]|nr:hypothetical protein Barb4_03043 [Bacteroidales bacterium Barb4]